MVHKVFSHFKAGFEPKTANGADFAKSADKHGTIGEQKSLTSPAHKRII